MGGRQPLESTALTHPIITEFPFKGVGGGEGFQGGVLERAASVAF